MIRHRSVPAVSALVIAMAIAFCSLTSNAVQADACSVQTQPAPATGMTSGADCAWRFPDGKTFDQEFPQRLDQPLYILLPLILAIPLVVMMPASAWIDLGGAARRRLMYLVPGYPADPHSP
jgi:hypothetical protein